MGMMHGEGMDEFDAEGLGRIVADEPGGTNGSAVSPHPVGWTLPSALAPGLAVVADPVFVFPLAVEGRPGPLAYANPAIANILGRPLAELAGIDPHLLFPSGQRDLLDELVARLLATGAALERTLLEGPGGMQLPVEINAGLVEAQGDTLAVFVCRSLRRRLAVREALESATSNYRRLFDDAVQGGFQTTMEGRFVRANQAMVDMLGYASIEDLILSIKDITEQLYVAPVDRERYLKVLAVEGKARRYETRFRRKDGEIIWVSLNVRLLRGADGGDIIEGFCTDITDVKRAEQALRESEELHRVLLMSLSDAVCITDALGRFTYVSPNAEAMFGLPPAGVMALPGVEALLGPELCCARVLGQRDEVHNVEASVRVGGVEKCLLVTVKAVDIAGGTCMYTCRDVTALRDLQDEARRAAQLASLGEMAAGVAHEINSPLNGIMLYAEVLQDEAVDLGEAVDAPERILRQGERVSAIVRKLLAFARTPEQAVCPVDVAAIMDDTLELARAQLVRDGVRLGMDVPEGLPPVVGREQEVQQVFMNLVSNARDALNERHPVGGADKRLDIAVRVGQSGGRRCVRVEFRDQGAGIPDSMRGRILTPFFSTKPKGQGTGLGLPITLRLLTDLGGRLDIDSREGGPTCVAAEFAVWEGDGE